MVGAAELLCGVDGYGLGRCSGVVGDELLVSALSVPQVLTNACITRNARDFPAPTSAGLYNSTYEHFDVMGVLNADLSLNEDSWEKAKPLLLTPYL
jgi:hypothetical protein